MVEWAREKYDTPDEYTESKCYYVFFEETLCIHAITQ